MASNINYISIDETFPVAGKDNDSQGFRDNFHYIKNNFSAAKTEIEDLQLYSARKDEANDFNNLNISKANFINCSEATYNGGNVSSGTLVDYQLGSYQTYTITGNNVILTLTNFPTAAAGKLTVVLYSNSSILHSVTFSATGGSTIKKSLAVSSMLGTIACTATASDTDLITCASTSSLQVNQPIQFSGTAIGGLISGQTYFVKQIISNTFSVSELAVAGVAQDVKQLSTYNAGQSSMVIAKQIIVDSATNPMVFEFWSTDGGNTIMMDYKGQYV
jgi:hypothetical protein